VGSGVTPSSPSGAPPLASALECWQQSIFNGLRQRARTVPPSRLSKWHREKHRTRSLSLRCMASRNQTMASRASTTCTHAVMDGTRLVRRDTSIILIIMRIPISSISMFKLALHSLSHQLGPSNHAWGVHTLTRPVAVGCSHGVGETMVNSGLDHDDQQGWSTRSTRPGIDDRYDVLYLTTHILTISYVFTACARFRIEYASLIEYMPPPSTSSFRSAANAAAHNFMHRTRNLPLD
jgi:hypothetical protein